MKKIAVLLTCFNRKQKTLSCLTRLYNAELPDEVEFDVFLVDDGSTDGTSDAVRSGFPEVNIIQGNGNLFWNKGMRLAWQTASNTRDYDFYFWLNDDTLLANSALSDLFDVFSTALQRDKKPAIVVGACSQDHQTNEFSYGGKTDNGPVIPNGELQKCKYVNGNAVLVPKQIFLEVGMLSEDYTHTMGDIDYGMRVLNKGFNVYTSKTFIASCPTNKGFPTWCNPEKKLKERWQFLHSPRGLNIKEYNKFRRKFWGNRWLIYAAKAYLRTLFPTYYNKFSNIEG